MSILLRTIVLVAAALAALYLADLFAPAGVGANIGAGILAFAVVAAISLAWAIFDGRTESTLPVLLVRWLVVGLLIGVFFSINPQLGGPTGIDWSVWRSDLFNSMVLGLVLSAVPGAIGVAIGRAVG